MSKLRLIVCAMFALCISSAASADWYSGDPYLAPTAWPQFTDNFSPAAFVPNEMAMTFDNFAWGGGTVDIVGGHFHSYGQHSGLATDLAYWEIRTGMAHNVAGSLLYSGGGVVTPYLTSFTQSGVPVYGVSVDVSDFALPTGNYWFGLAIGTTSSNYLDVGAFAASTYGVNGIGGPLYDDLSIYYQEIASVITFNYLESAIVNPPPMTGFDPSYYINEVPEPATLGSLTLGVLLTLTTTRRGRKQPA